MAEKHCAHFKKGPKIFKKRTKRGSIFEQKGDLKGTKKWSPQWGTLSKKNPWRRMKNDKRRIWEKYEEETAATK